jgi:3-oxoacyl-[acyl-carrier-protein] synthase-3
LIYASTTQDCIEPGTSSIIIGQLWLSCFCFDVKNACNSMINALEIADSFIYSWKYKKILIVWAETPSKAIKFSHKDKESFRQSFSSFGMWDAAVAMIIEAREWIKQWFLYSDNITNWSLREESTILWWWSRHYDSLEHNFFIGNPTNLKDFFLTDWKPMLDRWCKHVWLSYNQFEKIFVHQVWNESYYTILDALEISESKLIKTYKDFWNVWACTVPLQIALSGLEAEKTYLIIGLWAGASITCHIYRH